MSRTKGALGDKPWKEAIRKAVNGRTEQGRKVLEDLADILIRSALAGDTVALKEVGDRLDGKPRQEIEATVTDERMVVEAPAVAQDADEWAGKHGPH